MHQPVPIEKFGKDHWSTFHYVESQYNHADELCRLSIPKMRCNPNTHPLLAHLRTWAPGRGTRLKGFYQQQNPYDDAASVKAGLLLPDHDDWDCIDDLEEAGFIEIISLSVPTMMLTELGKKVLKQLNSFKRAGGNYADFTYTEKQA